MGNSLHSLKKMFSIQGSMNNSPAGFIVRRDTCGNRDGAVPTTSSPDANGRPCRPFLERLEDRRLLATNITQYHVDSQSTGANLTETQLTPSNVNAADFGQLYNTPLDGQVYAEPLVLTNVTIAAGPNTVGTPGTYNSVVFVATEHDSLYAINAANGAILWQRTFLDTTNPNDYLPGATSVTTIPSEDTRFGRHQPGDRHHQYPGHRPVHEHHLCLCRNTKEIVGGNAYYVQRLHAINVGDGTDAAPSFVIGTPPTTTPITHRSTSTARATATSAAWFSSTPCTRTTAPR